MKKIICENSVGISASINSPEIEMESKNSAKDVIKVNERYELRYSLSPKIPSKQYGRKIRIQLLKLTEEDKKDVL